MIGAGAMLLDSIADEIGVLFFDYGKSATYDPAGSTPSFMVSAVFFRLRTDELERRFLRDVCECWIRHSELAAQGLSVPVVRSDKTRGDLITAPDQNGQPISWAVVETALDLGIWVLTLEKKLRIQA